MPRPHAVALRDLEQAPAQPMPDTRRHMISDLEPLRPLCTRLGRRLALVQVRTPDDWRRLAAVIPELGPCPDLRRGIVAGLLSCSGTFVGGDWPFEWRALRVHEGAGLIEAHFEAGTYLPDGFAYLETAHVPGLAAVLAVSVDGVQFLSRQVGDE